MESYSDEIRYRGWMYSLSSALNECRQTLNDLSRKVPDSKIKISYGWEQFVPRCSTVGDFFNK
jgi:hypothetical protein